MGVLWDSYRARYPLACWISIAFAIHSCWISTVGSVIIHSFDLLHLGIACLSSRLISHYSFL